MIVTCWRSAEIQSRSAHSRVPTSTSTTNVRLNIALPQPQRSSGSSSSPAVPIPPPFRVVLCGRLRGFGQQSTQQTVALLGNVANRCLFFHWNFPGHQPQIGCHLLAGLEAPGIAEGGTGHGYERTYSFVASHFPEMELSG
jgi:hypothetical protein